MDLTNIAKGEAPYPPALIRFLGDQAPATVSVLGDPDLLALELTALFVSVRCPGNLILKVHDLAEQLRDAGTPVISGFHTPVEQHCLRVLLRGGAPTVICPARGIARMRLPEAWRAGLDERRLTVVSPFQAAVARATIDTAAVRNRFVAALAWQIVVGYAEPGGKTEALLTEAAGWGKPTICYSDSVQQSDGIQDDA